ncbi:ABC-type glycerol-3-phosphate transport system substrate-binding protein [Streptomyces aurantiacus]|uniref:ABC transporter substrate-binding protein n=1 Tax=Streptomyces aurantiacus TaxID=47760 RepID=UPI002792E1CC|nr:extracellular solute-binding protein [Streptomyces aurantiacus]MDQ0772009.1 ABC-type glycerol-3-phosphate transport system substrate-binding protein [Streptomyces aurantiacus]
MTTGTRRPTSRGVRGISRRGLLTSAGVGVGALLGAVGLTGCGGDASGSGGTTIRFYEQKTEVLAYFDKLLRQFEKRRPGIKVIHDDTVIIAPQFVREKPADVGCFNDNLELARYIERGVLSDLSDLPAARRIPADIGRLSEQYAKYPGRTSVLPYSLAAAGVIYNKQIFAEHRLPVPTTWSEFIDVCKELKTAGVTPIYATGKDTWTIWQGLFDYAVGSLVDTPSFFSRLDEQGTDIGPDSAVSFQKTFAEPMDRARAITRYYNPDAASRSYADGNLAFGKGQAAMYLQGPWALSQIAAVNPKLDVGTFALPVTDRAGDRQARVNIDLALWIPTGSQHKDEARELVNFLMEPAIINGYNRDNLAYGVTEDAPPAKDPRLAGLQPYVDSAAFYPGAGTFIPVSIPLGNYLQSAISSGNFESMLKQLDSDWRRLAIRSSA